MSKKSHKTTTPDAKSDSGKSGGQRLDELANPKEPTDAPAKAPTAGADGPPEIEARSEAPRGEAKGPDEAKAPESLPVTSANVTDMRVATLAQKLATGKADALGTVVCLYLSAAEGILPQIDPAHLATWATHSGMSDIWRAAMWDALVTSGWLVKDKAQKGKWKLAAWDATRQMGVDGSAKA